MRTTTIIYSDTTDAKISPSEGKLTLKFQPDSLQDLLNSLMRLTNELANAIGTQQNANNSQRVSISQFAQNNNVNQSIIPQDLRNDVFQLTQSNRTPQAPPLDMNKAAEARKLAQALAEFDEDLVNAQPTVDLTQNQNQVNQDQNQMITLPNGQQVDANVLLQMLNQNQNQTTPPKRQRPDSKYAKMAQEGKKQAEQMGLNPSNAIGR